MIQSKRNQLANTQNRFQGKTKKVLTVCSAGLLRSPTIASVLHTEYGYNVRACGVSEEYALIQISTALLAWADLVVFADSEHYHTVKEYLHTNQPFVVLDLPDEFGYNDTKLVEEIKLKLKNYFEKNPLI